MIWESYGKYGAGSRVREMLGDRTSNMGASYTKEQEMLHAHTYLSLPWTFGLTMVDDELPRREISSKKGINFNDPGPFRIQQHNRISALTVMIGPFSYPGASKCRPRVHADAIMSMIHVSPAIGFYAISARNTAVISCKCNGDGRLIFLNPSHLCPL